MLLCLRFDWSMIWQRPTGCALQSGGGTGTTVRARVSGRISCAWGELKCPAARRAKRVCGRGAKQTVCAQTRGALEMA
eukprot:2112108-Rhodomonas_salina.1